MCEAVQNELKDIARTARDQGVGPYSTQSDVVMALCLIEWLAKALLDTVDIKETTK